MPNTVAAVCSPNLPTERAKVKSLTDIRTLADDSPKDVKWDRHKRTTERLTDVFRYDEQDETLSRYADRVSDCSSALEYRELMDPDTGELSLKLSGAQFCRVRLCPICQWRRSMRWIAKMHEALPVIMTENPRSRFILLTLTVRNCAPQETRKQLDEMGLAWQRLIKRKEFRPVLGWARTVEVTRSKIGESHPHYHVVLMVGPDYWGRNYVTHAKWVTLWKSCAKLDYHPQVNVKAVRRKKTFHPDPAVQAEYEKTLIDGYEPVAKGVIEVLKYAVKPDEMDADPHTDQADWVREMAIQLHKTRAIATGGALKDFFKDSDDEEMTDDEMIHTCAKSEEAGDAEQADDEGRRLIFQFSKARQHFWRPKALA